MQALSSTITKIEGQKNNKDRVNVFINGEYSFSCSTEIVFTHSLRVGLSVDIKTLRDIVDEDSFIKGKNAALKIIERSYKSEKEIFDKLLLKGYSEKTISRIIKFLKDYNFLDDYKFAEIVIKDKILSQGKNKIKYYLMRKGIPREIIEEQLSKIDEEKELSTAAKLGEKKYKNLLVTERDIKKVHKKTGEFLIRNGFNSDLVKEVLNKIVCEEELETSEKPLEKQDEIHSIAVKRYNLLIKSEKDNRKLYKKLGDFLLRKGYPWEQVKDELKLITKNEIYEE